MNLPNKLTLSRFALTVAFLAVLFSRVTYHETAALLLFSAASLTDYFDGKIARSDKLITNFGILMDPLADKILVCSAFIAFVRAGLDGGVDGGDRGGAGTGDHRAAAAGGVEEPGAGGGGVRQAQDDFADCGDHRDPGVPLLPAMRRGGNGGVWF